MPTNAQALPRCESASRHWGRQSTRALLVAACLGLASVTGWAAPREQQKMTDQQIARAVDHTLLTDSALLYDQIDTEVTEGIVTLSGTAYRLMAKDRAARIAQSIRGVRGVVNTIFLKTPLMSDDTVRQEVESALLYDAATDSYELTPAVTDGIVTLRGTVQSYLEKQLAVHVAKGVRGVQEVRDSITVRTIGKRPDSEIAAEVNRAFATSVWLATSIIAADVKAGVVTLTGTVNSAALHSRASQLAWTANVRSVDVSGLKIDPWPRASDQSNETTATKEDSEIKEAVKAAFLYDPRVFSLSPAVDVEHGVVTLTGVVDNLKAKRAAEQDAKNTVGVWRVKNLLKVRPAKPLSDDLLQQGVTLALLRDPFVDSYQITVKATNAVVTLTGTVPSYFQKAQAEDIASRANGVLSVRNNLAVSDPALVYHDLGYDPDWAYGPFYSYWDQARSSYYSTWPYLSDAEVRDDIETEMFWSPWVNSADITVEVANGVATLTGTAGSWFEYSKATESAYQGGASRVYNRIVVK